MPSHPCRFVEFLLVTPIAIAKQTAGRIVPRESFQQLLGRPFRRAIRSHGKMNRASPTRLRS
jgi:hypothetical protein